MPQLPSDADTLRGLRQRDQAAFAILYQFYYPVVERFVLRNSGTRDDARDVFQETVLVLLDKVPREDFVLTSSLKTYVFAVGSNLWLKRLRTARRLVRVDDERNWENYPALDAAWPSAAESAEATLPGVLRRWLGRISAHCQTLLRAVFFQHKNPVELGYKNQHSAQNQQYKCLQQLRHVSKPGELEGE